MYYDASSLLSIAAAAPFDKTFEKCKYKSCVFTAPYSTGLVLHFIQIKYLNTV